MDSNPNDFKGLGGCPARVNWESFMADGKGYWQIPKDLDTLHD